MSSHLNYLMELGNFSVEFKLSKITPVYKKNSNELLKNIVIYSRLYKYFVSYMKLLLTTNSN